uniref:Uncharacterized protein n=1 Tax=Catagonus wagneri TaxID=51154 RepID=A0A8C3VU83_9CETA
MPGSEGGSQRAASSLMVGDHNPNPRDLFIYLASQGRISNSNLCDLGGKILPCQPEDLGKMRGRKERGRRS